MRPAEVCWLLEQACLAEYCHHVAQSCRTQTFPIVKKTSKSLRGHRLASCDVHLDDGSKHHPLARTEA